MYKIFYEVGYCCMLSILSILSILWHRNYIINCTMLNSCQYRILSTQDILNILNMYNNFNIFGM
jgi:hypothetical protein